MSVKVMHAGHFLLTAECIMRQVVFSAPRTSVTHLPKSAEDTVFILIIINSLLSLLSLYHILYSSVFYFSFSLKFFKAQTIFNIKKNISIDYPFPPLIPILNSQLFSTFLNKFLSFLSSPATSFDDVIISGHFNIHVDNIICPHTISFVTQITLISHIVYIALTFSFLTQITVVSNIVYIALTFCFLTQIAYLKHSIHCLDHQFSDLDSISLKHRVSCLDLQFSDLDSVSLKHRISCLDLQFSDLDSISLKHRISCLDLQFSDLDSISLKHRIHYLDLLITHAYTALYQIIISSVTNTTDQYPVLR